MAEATNTERHVNRFAIPRKDGGPNNPSPHRYNLPFFLQIGAPPDRLSEAPVDDAVSDSVEHSV